MKLRFIAILSLMLLGCGGSPGPVTRNAELTVEYFGKKVKHEKPTWTNEAQLRQILEKPGKKYLVFGADWCGSCSFLRRALREGNYLQKVDFINVDEQWVTNVASFYGIDTLPTMIEIDPKSKITAIKVGPGQIVLHLIINEGKKNEITK